jgi:hypothetical protein
LLAGSFSCSSLLCCISQGPLLLNWANYTPTLPTSASFSSQTAFTQTSTYFLFFKRHLIQLCHLSSPLPTTFIPTHVPMTTTGTSSTTAAVSNLLWLIINSCYSSFLCLANGNHDGTNVKTLAAEESQ